MKNSYINFYSAYGKSNRLLFVMVSVFIVNFTLIIENCMSQWVQSDGIYGGDINCLVTQGSNIYAGAPFHGVYKTTNYGGSWIRTSLGDYGVRSLGSIGNNIIACTASGVVYISTDEGANWSQTNLYTSNVWAFITAGSNIFAGAENGEGIYRSADNGMTWNPSGLSGYDVESFTVSGSNIFAGVYNNPPGSGGVYISTDSGSSWSQKFSNQSVFSMASLGSNIFAGTWGNGVYISTNSGLNWAPTSLINKKVRGLISHGGNIFAGTDSGVYVSSNTGTNWNLTLDDKSQCRFTSSGTNLFAGGNGGTNGIWLTTNTGTNWNKTAFNKLIISSFTSGGTNIYAGTQSHGIFITTNNGLNWVQTGLNDRSVNVLTTSGSNVYAGCDGVYISTNNGTTWNQTGLNNYTINALTTSGSYIFAGTTSQSGVFRSTDNGINWTQTSLNDVSVLCLAANGSNIFAGTVYGVYKSTDYGDNWILTSMNWSTKCLASNGINIIYAGTVSSTGGVFFSQNNGGTWNYIGPSDQRIYALAISGNILIAGVLKYQSSSLGGVWVYNGTSWSQRSEGFPGIYTINSLLTANNYIFAGANVCSAWRRPVSEITGNQIVSSEIPQGFSLSQNYPNPFNPVTVISYQLPARSAGRVVSSFVSLIVYDALGKEVATLINEQLKPGIYEAEWDASNYSSGIYYYRLIVEDYTETKKMSLIK